MSLFDNMPQARAVPSHSMADSRFQLARGEIQAAFCSEFVGLDKPKRILSKFADAPYPSAWLFVGSSGTGKTTMALAFCEAIRARIDIIFPRSDAMSKRWKMYPPMSLCFRARAGLSTSF